MTFAIILATNINNRFRIQHSKIRIINIGNQRVKESNRIARTVENLRGIGYGVEETEDGVLLQGVPEYREGREGVVKFVTDGDHRLAMSMGVLGVWLTQYYQGKVQVVIDSK